MGLLERFGLSPKSKKGAPSIGEKKKKEEQETAGRRKKYARFGIQFVFLLIIVILLPQPSFQPVANYSLDEPWRADDLTAPFTFSIKKTEGELNDEREEVRANTPPVFHVDNEASMNIESRIDSLYRDLQPVLDAYVQWQNAKSNPNVSSSNDSLRFIEELNFSGIEFNDSAWNTILDTYISLRPDNRRSNSFIMNNIRGTLESVIDRLLDDGVINRPKSNIEQNRIIVRNLEDRTERTRNLGNLRDMEEAFKFADNRFSEEQTSSVANVAIQIIRQVMLPNLIYNPEDTESRLQENLDSISNTKGAVAQGQVIIRRGDIVTEEKANILESLATARASSATTLEKWLRYSGEIIVLIITSLVFIMYLFLYRRKIHDDVSMYLLVFLTLTIICVGSAVVYPFDQVNNYIVSVAIAPIILTIIFDSRVGLLATFTLAIITGLYHDYDFQYLVATTTACSLGVFSVRDIKNRSQFFFTTPGIVFITYVLVIGGFSLSRFSGLETYLNNVFFVLINSLFILFTYPLILLFEKLFKITTDFTLLELSDTNHPLLKELMNKAPGSFHHSLQVSNLSEAAASAIGANALLCRVAAMFHDVGKMDKPDYFVENQAGERNEHDKLKPQMSALVIKNHVSEGVKLAKEHNLPEVIIDFIKTHHGTSLIRFFYEKAKKKDKSDSDILEDDFRYDGPRPFTKEQGIMMLADGIEAASRSMKDHSYSKLNTLINRMIEINISDNQLNHCPLTFSQIEIIKQAFLNILVGVYHKRIEYPDDKKKQDEKNKKTEENSQEKEEAPETADK